MPQPIDRNYLFDKGEWSTHLGNNAYQPEMVNDLLRNEGMTGVHDLDDAIGAVSEALRNGEFGYPEPEHEELYSQYLDDDDWNYLALEIITTQLDEDELMDYLWNWNSYDVDLGDIASKAVIGSDPYWKIAYEIGKHVLDDGFNIYEIKGSDGVKEAYDTVTPVTPELKKAVKNIRFLQAYAIEGDMTDNIVKEIQDNRDTIIDIVMDLIKEA